MQNKAVNFWGPLLVFLLLSYFSLFHLLQRHPMYWWDESSYALNAQEMIERGNPIEVYLLGQPDLYNSKPPFAIWCMASCIKVFGFNELGARMASAIFALLTAALLWILGIKITHNRWLALIFPAILFSSIGYTGWHIARTGDTDSILVFWIFLQSIFIFSYTNTDSAKKETLYLALFGLAFSFGCLTKGIAGITAIPGIVAWIIYKGKIKSILLNKGFYIALFSFLLLVIGYYWLRSSLTPGYFQAVMENEIGGRLQRQDFLNQKTLPFYFYFESMITQERFFIWIFILPISIIYILISKHSMTKQVGLFFIFIFFSISGLLAISKTKLEWYDAPLYPVMSIIIGVSFIILITEKSKKFIILFICCMGWPFFKVVANNSSSFSGSAIGNFMRLIRKKGHSKDTVHIINSNPNFFVVYFYAKKDSLLGYSNKVVLADDASLSAGDYILTQQYERDVDVHKIFNLEPILHYKECNYYRIINKK